MRIPPLVVAALALSCSGPSTPKADDEVAVKGSVSDALYKTRIAGAQVCLVEPANGPCVDTGVDGQFELHAKKNSRVIVRFIKNGYYPNQAHYTTHDDEEFLTYLLTNDEVNDLAFNIANVTRDDSKATILFAVRSGKGPDAVNVPDVVLSLDPVSGEGPFYVTGSAGLDKNQAGTSSTGGGTIFNVEPGMYRMRFSHPTKACTPYYGWAHEGTVDTLDVKAESGFITYSNMICVDP